MRLDRGVAAPGADDGLLEPAIGEDIPGVGELGELEAGGAVGLGGVVIDVRDDVQDAGVSGGHGR